jgi:hypothetical protein
MCRNFVFWAANQLEPMEIISHLHTLPIQKLTGGEANVPD